MKIQFLLFLIILQLVAAGQFDTSEIQADQPDHHKKQQHKKVKVKKHRFRKFMKGAKDFMVAIPTAIFNSFKNGAKAIAHPVETKNNIKLAWKNRKQTWASLKKAMSKHCRKNKATCAGEATGLVATSALSFGAGPAVSALGVGSKALVATEAAVLGVSSARGAGVVNEAADAYKEDVKKENQKRRHLKALREKFHHLKNKARNHFYPQQIVHNQDEWQPEWQSFHYKKNE